MATITDRLGQFTGQVGPVRFVKGVATTEDPDMVAYFAADPDRYDVETDDLPDDGISDLPMRTGNVGPDNPYNVED